MNQTHFILISILILLIFIHIYEIIICLNENLNNNIISSNNMPVNDYSYDNEQDLLVPDRPNGYGLYDTNRPANNYGRQTTDTDLDSKVDNQTLLLNTTGDTPIVYSLDQLEVTSTSMYAPAFTPSMLPLYIKPIDTGSGKIVMNDGDVNNNELNGFMIIISNGYSIIGNGKILEHTLGKIKTLKAEKEILENSYIPIVMY